MASARCSAHRRWARRVRPMATARRIPSRACRRRGRVASSPVPRPRRSLARRAASPEDVRGARRAHARRAPPRMTPPRRLHPATDAALRLRRGPARAISCAAVLMGPAWWSACARTSPRWSARGGVGRGCRGRWRRRRRRARSPQTRPGTSSAASDRLLCPASREAALRGCVFSRGVWQSVGHQLVVGRRFVVLELPRADFRSSDGNSLPDSEFVAVLGIT